MTMRIFVPGDAGAVAVGADEVATALEQAAGKAGIAVEIVRTGSRGLYWLEPMVEVATSQGRIAFGPVAAADVPTVFDAITAGGAHPSPTPSRAPTRLFASRSASLETSRLVHCLTPRCRSAALRPQCECLS